MTELMPRQQQILELARYTGRVTVEALAARFDVSVQTIRKDLNEMCDLRLLERVHGGAVVSSSVENLGYAARRLVNQREKDAIGRAAAALIPNNTSLFVNVGTTTEAFARALLDHSGLLVITNNINVATILYPSSRLEVILAGGPVRRSDGAIVGEAAAQFMRQFRVDHAVIGASAIDAEGALLDFDYREVVVSRAIIDNARQTVLLADAMKFARTAPVRIGHLREVDIFVTDRLPDADTAALCRRHEVEVMETAG